MFISKPLIIVISSPSGVGKDAVIKKLREGLQGIPKLQIREYMGKGYDIILRVDIQGVATLRKILGDLTLFILLVVESKHALVNRFTDRKTEIKETLLVRTACEEVRHINNSDYVAINAQGQLVKAVKSVESIMDT